MGFLYNTRISAISTGSEALQLPTLSSTNVWTHYSNYQDIVLTSFEKVYLVADEF